MAIIPARNEEAVIARAVRSLPPDTVIVVDDHSEDGTAEAARQAGAGVLPAPPLPRNGIGKANACAAGARALTSRWILFTDADTWFEEGFLPAVVAAAEASGVSLLSIYLQPECETFAERVLVPYARALFFCGGNPKRNPQCVLQRPMSSGSARGLHVPGHPRGGGRATGGGREADVAGPAAPVEVCHRARHRAGPRAHVRRAFRHPRPESSGMRFASWW